MRVTYGDVELQMVHMRNVTKRPRFSEDGSTYLWTDYTIDMVCIYNPRCTSYGLAAGVPVPGPGADAFETDIALKSYLLQPRRRLRILTAAGDVWIEAPKVGFDVDNNNGPRCTFCSIQEPTGVLKTFEVHLIFECSVNSCPSDKILLSHRWKRYADVDQDFTTIIATEGEAVFNLPVLVKNGWRPDDFRIALFHAIPDYCKREKIDIQPGSDGITYRYRIVDREQMVSLGQTFPGTRVEVYKTGFYAKGSVIRAGAHMFNPAGPAQAFFDNGGGAQPRPFWERVGRAAIQGGRQIFEGVAAAMPSYSIMVLVRAWGSRGVTRKRIRLKAYEILSYQMSISIPPALGLINVQDQLAREFTQVEDLAGRFVEVQKTISWGVDNLGGPGFIEQGGIPANIEFAFNNDERLIPGIPVNEKKNPEPTLQAYGPLLQPLVAQALSSACSLPPEPQDNDSVRARSLETGAQLGVS